MNLTDEEYLSLMSNKKIYSEILLGILRYIPAKEIADETKQKIEIKNKLKFKHVDDPDLLRSCIDLLEDTEDAVVEFNKNGLGKGRGTGEQYLKLYGLLSAIYQQIAVLIELTEIFNFPGKTAHSKALKNLPIFHLRNKLAAHTINYQIYREKHSRDNNDFFRVAQANLSQWGTDLLVVSHRSAPENVNLPALISEYSAFADELLAGICEKAIKSLFPNNNKHKQWLTFRFNFVENRRESETTKRQ